MRGNTAPNVIVAGAGPVGLATALSLHHRDIPVQIIERDDRPGTHSYALALHPSTLELLREWGVSKQLERTGLEVQQLRFTNREGEHFDLDLRKVPSYRAGLLIIGQDHLEAALVEPLERAKISIRWNHRLADLQQDDEGVDLSLEHLSEGMSGYAAARLEWQIDKESRSRAAYVVGADGHFSMVRRKLGIEFPKVAPTQSFAVFEFKTDFDHGNKAHIVFGKEGTNILWPLPGGYCRWGFEIEKAEAEQYSRDKDRLFVQVGSHGYHLLESGVLESMLEERAPWFNGSIGAFRWRMIVRFEKRLTESFGRDRVWLAGDAGHIAAPIGMQSMNVGIQEGHFLGNAIADVMQSKSGAKKLAAYAIDRQREWRSLMGIDTALQKREHTPTLLSQYADRLLECMPTSQGSLPAFAELLGMDLVETARMS